MHLPAAFRSLPRPSSPPGAKASPMRPSFASIFSTQRMNLNFFAAASVAFQQPTPTFLHQARSRALFARLFLLLSPLLLSLRLPPSLVNELFTPFRVILSFQRSGLGAFQKHLQVVTDTIRRIRTGIISFETTCPSLCRDSVAIYSLSRFAQLPKRWRISDSNR